MEIMVLKAAGGSMSPFIKSGSFIWIEKTGPEYVKRGDAVLYEINGQKYLHRVFKKQCHKLILRDDSGVTGFHSINEESVLGKQLTVMNGLVGLIVSEVSLFLKKIRQNIN